MLDYQNNYEGLCSIMMSNITKNFDILASILNVLHFLREKNGCSYRNLIIIYVILDANYIFCKTINI